MRATGTAFVSHGRYYLCHPGTSLSWVRVDDASDKLLHVFESGEGGVCVRTGTIDGPVTVTVETSEALPAETPDLIEWDRIEALTIVSKGTSVQAMVDDGEIEDVPALTLAPGDHYRVRVAVRGFAAGRAVQAPDPDDEPVEHHLVQMWPKSWPAHLEDDRW